MLHKQKLCHINTLSFEFFKTFSCFINSTHRSEKRNTQLRRVFRRSFCNYSDHNEATTFSFQSTLCKRWTNLSPFSLPILLHRTLFFLFLLPILDFSLKHVQVKQNIFGCYIGEGEWICYGGYTVVIWGSDNPKARTFCGPCLSHSSSCIHQ